jgi:RNA polymerase sigma-70 factor (ECF subfamily)
MSSEIAAYFPDALASASEVRGTARSFSETPSVPPDGIHSDTNNSERFLSTSTGEDSDEALLEQVGQGMKDALGLLFRRNARTVRNVAFRILRDEAEADDLVQEVFLYIFRKASLFKATHCSARSWIIQVTYHRAFDRRRYLNTRHFDVSRGLEEAALKVAERQHERLFSQWSLEGIFGRDFSAKLKGLLSPAQLSTIELHFFEGYTLEEIAERQGQTLSNIRSYYYRGLEKLRKCIFAGTLRSK